jgi:hypothetical protein
MVNIGQNEVGLPEIQLGAIEKSRHPITRNLMAIKTTFNGHTLAMTKKKGGD